MKLIPRDGIPTKYWYIRVYLDENPWIDFEVIRGLNIYLDRSLSTPNSFESNQDKDKRDYLSYGFPSQALRRSFLRHLQHVKGPAKVRIRYWVDSHSKIGGYFIPGDPCRFFPNIRLFSYFRGRTKELDTERNFRTVPRWLVVFSKAPFGLCQTASLRMPRTFLDVWGISAITVIRTRMVLAYILRSVP
jgi:hypothetical protein